MSGRKKKTFALLAVALFLVFGLRPDPGVYGLSATSPWWTEMTYMWMHASFIHYGMNLWVLWQLARLNPWRHLLAACAAAMLVPDFCLTATPTVGLSGMLFAAMGMMWYRFRDIRRSQLYFGALLALGLAAWALGAPVNPFIHIWCYAAGTVIGILIRPSWKRHGENCLRKTAGDLKRRTVRSTR